MTAPASVKLVPTGATALGGTSDPLRDPLRGRAREQLLEAASALMREGSTIDISLSDIASRSGMNAALVKYYFGNKYGMMCALVERDLAEASAQLAELVAMDLSPKRKMHIHISGIVKLHFTYPYLSRLLMDVVRYGDDKVSRTIADRYLVPMTDAYRTILEAGVACGEFKPVDPEIFYFTVVGACDQVITSRVVRKYASRPDASNEIERRRYVDGLRTILLSGLCV